MSDAVTYVVGFLVVFFAAAIGYGIWLHFALEQARKAYAAALAELQHYPHDADLRRETLMMGRRYVDLAKRAKGGRGASVFDELMLTNDIQAACAGAGHQEYTRKARKRQEPEYVAEADLTEPARPKRSIEERLAKLDRLFQENVISLQEFKEQRRKILDEV